MSELWIVLPPPRREPEVTLTVVLAIALTVHVFPLIAADPDLGAPGEEITFDEGPCYFPGGDFPEEPPYPDEDLYAPLLFDNLSPALARQQAIEQARIGGVGSFAIEEHHHDPDEYCVLHDFGSRFHPLRVATPMPPRRQLDDDELEHLLDFEKPQPIAIGIVTGGPVDKWTIRRSLKRATGELARCDHTRLSLRLGDDVHVDDGVFGATFTIERDGRLAQIITDDTGSTSACVTRVLKTIELPKADAPTPVRVTLRYGTTERSAGVLVR